MPRANAKPARSNNGRAVVVGASALALLYAKRQAASAVQATVLPTDVVLVHTLGGKLEIDVLGQVLQLLVIRVLPVLVRAMAAIALYVLAAPIAIGTLRFSIEGWARMGLNYVMARAKRASLLLLRIVHFMLRNGFKVLVIIGRCG